MKNKIKKFIFLITVLAAVAFPVVVLASIDEGGFQEGYWRAQGESEMAGLTVEKSFTNIIGDAINWIMVILAVLSVLMFVVAGIMYVTANGDEETIGKAKKIITFGITGMAISLCGFLIVEVVAVIAGDCTSFICALVDLFFSFF